MNAMPSILINCFHHHYVQNQKPHCQTEIALIIKHDAEISHSD